MPSTTGSNENIFVIGENSTQNNYKLKNITNDTTIITNTSSRLNNSIAYAQLIKAITDGNLCLVKQMIDSGLDVNYIYDKEQNYTFLHLACLMGHSKVIKYLLDSGANPTVVTSSGHQPIDLIESDDLNSIAYMLIRMNSK